MADSERDVLAEALHAAMWTMGASAGIPVERRQEWADLGERLIRAELAAAGYTLTRSAPDPHVRPHNHKPDDHHWQDCPGCDDAAAALRAAQPSAEPGLDVREALDAAEAMADGILRWQRGSVLEHRATRFRRLAAALAPDRPTPGEAM